MSMKNRHIILKTTVNNQSIALAPVTDSECVQYNNSSLSCVNVRDGLNALNTKIDDLSNATMTFQRYNTKSAMEEDNTQSDGTLGYVEELNEYFIYSGSENGWKRDTDEVYDATSFIDSLNITDNGFTMTAAQWEELNRLNDSYSLLTYKNNVMNLVINDSTPSVDNDYIDDIGGGVHTLGGNINNGGTMDGPIATALNNVHIRWFNLNDNKIYDVYAENIPNKWFNNNYTQEDTISFSVSKPININANNLGSQSVITNINNSIAEKADAPFVVTFTTEDNVLSANHSLDEIQTANNNGKLIIGKYDEENDKGTTHYILNCNIINNNSAWFNSESRGSLLLISIEGQEDTVDAVNSITLPLTVLEKSWENWFSKAEITDIYTNLSDTDDKLTQDQYNKLSQTDQSGYTITETNAIVFYGMDNQIKNIVSTSMLNGIVSSVSVVNNDLVITFTNGQSTTLPISQIFNPNNYYTKTEIENAYNAFVVQFDSDGNITNNKTFNDVISALNDNKRVIYINPIDTGKEYYTVCEYVTGEIVSATRMYMTGGSVYLYRLQHHNDNNSITIQSNSVVTRSDLISSSSNNNQGARYVGYYSNNNKIITNVNSVRNALNKVDAVLPNTYDASWIVFKSSEDTELLYDSSTESWYCSDNRYTELGAFYNNFTQPYMQVYAIDNDSNYIQIHEFTKVDNVGFKLSWVEDELEVKTAYIDSRVTTGIGDGGYHRMVFSNKNINASISPIQTDIALLQTSISGVQGDIALKANKTLIVEFADAQTGQTQYEITSDDVGYNDVIAAFNEGTDVIYVYNIDQNQKQYYIVNSIDSEDGDIYIYAASCEYSYSNNAIIRRELCHDKFDNITIVSQIIPINLNNTDGASKIGYSGSANNNRVVNGPNVALALNSIDEHIPKAYNASWLFALTPNNDNQYYCSNSDFESLYNFYFAEQVNPPYTIYAYKEIYASKNSQYIEFDSINLEQEVDEDHVLLKLYWTDKNDDSIGDIKCATISSIQTDSGHQVTFNSMSNTYFTKNEVTTYVQGLGQLIGAKANKEDAKITKFEYITQNDGNRVELRITQGSNGNSNVKGFTLPVVIDNDNASHAGLMNVSQLKQLNKATEDIAKLKPYYIDIYYDSTDGNYYITDIFDDMVKAYKNGAEIKVRHKTTGHVIYSLCLVDGDHINDQTPDYNKSSFTFYCPIAPSHIGKTVKIDNDNGAVSVTVS